MLPDKLSDLIEVALKDLESVEQDPNYQVSMLQWHAFNEYRNVCAVCLAGCVLAKTLETPLTETLVDCHISVHPESKKLQALDYVRRGRISDALYLFGYPVKSWCEDVTPYKVHAERFKADLREIVSRLKDRGL